jgi:hypothetical protein
MLCLFSVAFLSMGGFISLYNYIGFRLLATPYHLSQSVISLIFLVYFLGSLSSAMMGRLMLRFGRRAVIRATIAAMACGALLTLPDSILCIVAGVALFTCGFFGVHSIASGWVSRRATTYRAQATSLYLFLLPRLQHLRHPGRFLLGQLWLVRSLCHDLPVTAMRPGKHRTAQQEVLRTSRITGENQPPICGGKPPQPLSLYTVYRRGRRGSQSKNKKLLSHTLQPKGIKQV